MDDRERFREMEQELRDERGRRRAAEGRIEELTDRADLWRRRAEERSTAINRLQEAQETRRGRLKQVLRKAGGPIVRIGRGSTTVSEEKGGQDSADTSLLVPGPDSPTRSWPAIRSVMVVSAVSDPSIVRCLDSFDTTRLADAEAGSLERADLVVIEPAALTALPGEAQDRLKTWSAQMGRQPLVVWTSRADVSVVGGLLSPRDVVAITHAGMAESLDAVYLPGCFDPAWHHPDESAAGDTHETVDDYRALLAAPPIGMVEMAASGIGFDPAPGAGTAARRWAYRHHSPWVRARQLLDVAGIGAPDPIPRMAGILVSHRPQSIPKTVQAILGQTYLATELIVGVHGQAPTPEIDALLSKATIPVKLILLERDLSLGECLNQAIAQTSAPLLAKIDDDDHYGPAHFEDSFHALSYSGAGIVGKGAQYTYIASRDETVLRRPGQEEMLIDGSPNGATLVFRRSVWDEVGFPDRPRHVDTGFLRAARSMGSTVYAGSRWEFCYVRNPHGHTWDAEESVFVAGSEPAWAGFHPERVEVADLGSL